MKKLIVILSVFLCLLSCNHPTQNTLTGTIEGLVPGDQLVLVRMDPQTSKNILLDQVTVTKPNEFRLATDATGTSVFLYYVEEGGDTSLDALQPGRMTCLVLFLEGYANLQLEGKVDYMFFTHVKGGLYDHKDMEELNRLDREGGAEQKQAFLLMDDAQESGNEETMEEARKLMQKANEKFRELDGLQKEFAKNHPELAYSASLIRFDFDLQKNIDEFERRYRELTPQVQASLAGQEVETLIAKIRNSEVGGTAPAFELLSLEGDPVKLSDMKGKYVILDFWGSWCGPCRAAAPTLIEFYNEIKDNDNIVMAGIGCWEQNADNWRQAIEEDGLPWLQLLDADNTVADVYVITGVPHTILISPEGIILKRDHPLTLIPEIKQMLEI